MLVALSIRDIVLIQKLDLEWRSGLCALTGETGAGKSILLDALGLATGARGDANLVRHGAAQGSVTASFDIGSSGGSPQNGGGNGPPNETARVLADNDIAHDGQIILRRVQTKDGRTRAFVNDQPISVNLLKEIGACLVEIHGQNESQSLTDADTQRYLLDSFAGHQADVRALSGHFAAMRDAKAHLETYRHARLKAAEQEDYLRHAVEELVQLAPALGEDVGLAEERTMLMNAEKITLDLNEALTLLEGDEGLQTSLNAALRRLEKNAPQAAGHLDEAVAAMERAIVESDEAHDALAQAAQKMVFSPARLQKVEERLFALKAAGRKFNVPCDELGRVQAQLTAQLDDIERGADSEAELEATYQKNTAAYRQAALAISAARHVAAKELDKTIAAELPPLKLDGGQFMTAIESCDIEQARLHGIDKIQFMASTNPGMPVGPIAKIASGGELARFMLALKVSLMKAGSADPKTIIFDEVDAGVGGAVAEAVGGRLKKLSTQNAGQVLVVTHSPQVAACGDHQWRITKQSGGDVTKTQVTELTSSDREEEIARMLAGSTVTAEARAAALKLLEA